MQLKNSTDRFGLVALSIHWIVAIGIIANFFIGKTLDSFQVTDPEWREIYPFHASIGVTILFLMLFRLFWRLKNVVPPAPKASKDWERKLIKITHWGFYIVLILLPLTGWALASTAAPNPTTTIYGGITWPYISWIWEMENRGDYTLLVHTIHEWLGYLFFGFFALHMAGIIKHTFILKDGTIKRMLPGK